MATAEDKATGWTAYWAPGKRDAIRKHADRVDKIIVISKDRLLLRCAFAGQLRRLDPVDMVRLGLVGPVTTFIKKEGHSQRKALERAWRLIWNIGEPDRLIACAIHYDSDHGDVLAYQDDAFGAQSPLATGVGHDDASLKRTYRDLDVLLGRSPDGLLRCSDASGWDLSVSADSYPKP